MAKLGQHFLYDPKIARRMCDAAAVGFNDVILEIGPGRGIITEELAKRAKRVYAIEKDSGLAIALEGRFKNVKVLQGDAVQIDWPYFDKMVASIPFEISSPLLGRIFLSGKPAVLVVQKEFADRLVAKPGERNYSRLSVSCDYYCRAELIGKLRPGAFKPAPKVSAAIIRLVPRRTPFRTNNGFWDIINRLFQHRRKTVRAALKAAHLEANLPERLLKKRVYHCGLFELKQITEAVK